MARTYDTYDRYKNYEGEASSGKAGRVLAGLAKTVALLVETVLLIAVVLYAVIYLLMNGPSEKVRDTVVMTFEETSALKWLPDLFLSKEEIAGIVERPPEEQYFPPVDSKPIPTPGPKETVNPAGGPAADAWGLVDEDGDGLILQEIHGSGYSGYMMVVLDPSRVIMGAVPESLGRRGYTVAEMVEYYDAVVGTNAGGFEDPEGRGNGSRPDSLIVFEGQTYFEFNGMGQGFVGIDDQYRLRVGLKTVAEVKDANIQYGVCFGPVLVADGQITEDSLKSSGLNPRTAIGQRSDGAILLMVIDGRQIISLGATYKDVAEVMLRYGAVNACNLDGGSSTLMWYGGDYINNCASVIGIRPVPSTFLVLKEGKRNG